MFTPNPAIFSSSAFSRGSQLQHAWPPLQPSYSHEPSASDSQQPGTAILFQTVLCYSELTKQLCVKHSEPKWEVLHKQPLPFLTDLLICWVLKFQETALITLVITSHTVFWSSLYTYNHKPKKKCRHMEHIFNSHSILQVLQGKEVTMATSYRLGCSDWTLGKTSPPQHNGTGCLVPEVCFSTHHSVLHSLKSNCFWTDPLEKHKAFVAATSIPTLLLYIQYIQYCTFHVKCPFIHLTFLQPTPIWAPPVQQMHDKEVCET